MGGASPLWVTPFLRLGCIRKLVEHFGLTCEPTHKQHPPWFLAWASAPDVPQWWTWMCKLNKSFSHQNWLCFECSVTDQRESYRTMGRKNLDTPTSAFQIQLKTVLSPVSSRVVVSQKVSNRCCMNDKGKGRASCDQTLLGLSIPHPSVSRVHQSAQYTGSASYMLHKWQTENNTRRAKQIPWQECDRSSILNRANSPVRPVGWQQSAFRWLYFGVFIF